MTTTSFEQRMHGTFSVDEEYELFVYAWMAYHQAADAVDGHLSPGDRSLVREAQAQGRHEQQAVLDRAMYPTDAIRNDAVTYAKWNQAKLEALRRLGK